jgi:4-hydroxy-3-methylbut-2-enyl diphosphate reductase
MEILLAKDMGFCWGVRRAIDIMETAAEKHGEIISVGPIVHNPQVVHELEEMGVRTNVKPGGDEHPVAITAHGVGPQIIDEVKRTGAEIIDGTCPIVTRSQRWARKMAEGGFTVLVFGDPDHREVRGVLGWAGDKAIAVRDGDPLPRPLPSRVAVISQTTQSPERFAEFVGRIMQDHVSEITELRLINTLCNITSGQQAAARELAQETDVVLVVGGKTSANTRHLLEVCHEEGTTAYHIESAADVEPEWLGACRRVGVTAGASTPDSAVEAVVTRVRDIADEFETTRAPVQS